MWKFNYINQSINSIINFIPYYTIFCIKLIVITYHQYRTTKKKLSLVRNIWHKIVKNLPLWNKKKAPNNENSYKKIDSSDFKKVTTWTWIQIEARAQKKGGNKWRMNIVNIGTTSLNEGTILCKQQCIQHVSLNFTLWIWVESSVGHTVLTIKW